MSGLFFILAVVFAVLYFLEKSKNKKRMALMQIENDKIIEEKVVMYNKLYDKYKDVINVEEQLEKLNKELQDKKKDIKDVTFKFNTLVNQMMATQSNIRVLQEQEDDLYVYGLYENKYEFESSLLFKNKLLEIQEKQKTLFSNNKAVVKKINWTIGGSAKEGLVYLEKITKLMLKAFNSECDVIIKNVKYSTVNKYIERIRKLADVINKLADKWGCEISEELIELKIKEIELSYEYQEKLESEKEEQRRIKELMREEERAIREAEKAKQDAMAEEKRYQDALIKAKQELTHVQGAELDELNRRIEELNQKLIEAEQKKARAISLAQTTKCGYVYIISNIGSFGENVYKIGMTRRAEPMDRVKELGDASVPFDFDVHALIYSDNAPELENILHRSFDKHRVNKVNNKKEYFKVDLESIRNRTIERGHSIEFTMLAEAKEYRETLFLENNRKN